MLILVPGVVHLTQDRCSARQFNRAQNGVDKGLGLVFRRLLSLISRCEEDNSFTALPVVKKIVSYSDLPVSCLGQIELQQGP